MLGSRSQFLSRSSDDQRVLAILEQFMLDQENGGSPDREKIIAENPDLGERLRDCFESMAAVESLAGGIDSTSSSKGSDQNLPELDDYRIIRELGRGGMGVVYEAEQISLSRRVALKVLPLAAVFDQTSLQRFKNEALATAQLEHANIINVYSVGCEKGIHFYSMQLVEGQSLSQVIRSLRRVDPDSPEAHDALSHVDDGSRRTQSPNESNSNETTANDSVTLSVESLSGALSAQGSRRRANFYRAIARIGCQAASALHHAHQMGIIHRDIKPSNLLLDSRGDIRVSDFGLATMQGEMHLTTSGDLLGTLKYMSPEQASGQQELVDSRTDVYSLGATLYELMTCRSVVEGKGRKQVLQNILEENIVPPSRINRSVPQDLETIVMKALSHSREARYATSGQMAEDLQRFLDDQPINARRPTIRQRCGKWLRRNRWVATTAAVFLFLLVAGSIASTVTIYRWYDKATVALARATEAEDALKKANEKLLQAVAVKDSTDQEIKRHAETYFIKGKEHYDKMQFREAETYFLSALELNANAIKNHLWIARCKYILMDIVAAEREATQCINRLSTMSDAERFNVAFELWEPYVLRATARISKPITKSYTTRITNFREWNLEQLRGAVADVEQAYSVAPRVRQVQITRLMAKFDLAVTLNNREQLEVVCQVALELLDRKVADRQVFEIALITLWQLNRFDEFRDVYRRFRDRQELATHGNLYLLNSLFEYKNGNSKKGLASYGRGIRWSLYRSPMTHHHDRYVRNWLMEKTASQAGLIFNAWRDGYTLANLYRFRIDSGSLVGRATGAPGDEVVTQHNMNNECGPYWTPDFRKLGSSQHGVQLFWRPVDRQSRLTFALFDTNEDAKELVSHGFLYKPYDFKPGRHRLTTNLTRSNDFAMVQFWWNGQKVGQPIDLYHPSPSQHGETDLGWVDVIEGRNVMEIEIVGRNPSAVGAPVFGMDYIDLWPEGFVPGRTYVSELGRRVNEFAILAHRSFSPWWFRRTTK